jgi:hypothetical protein
VVENQLFGTLERFSGYHYEQGVYAKPGTNSTGVAPEVMMKLGG